MKTGRITKDLLEDLRDNGMIYALYACMISSDNNTTNEERQEHIGWLKETEEAVKEINWNDKDDHLRRIRDGIDILQAEIDLPGDVF